MSSCFLIIDDNPDQILITRRILRKIPECTIDAAQDGAEALQRLQEKDYALVLCDYRLPKMSGIEVLCSIRQQQKKDIPFILVTSAGTERVAVEAMQHGAYDYVVKDAAYEEFLPQIIQKALDRYQERKERQRLEEEQRRSRTELEKAYAELKKAQQQLIQAAKLESVGRLAAGAAHEVKNPLNIMNMGLEYLIKKCPPNDEAFELVLESMKDAVRRADAVIHGLLEFSAYRLLEPKVQPLPPIIERAILMVKPAFDKAGIEMVQEYDQGLLPLLLDEIKLKQVFVSLFTNALHAMSRGGVLTVRTSQITAPEADWEFTGRFKGGTQVVLVRVEDTGMGILPEVLPKVFDPFFTTKATGQGTGLGLSVARTIIEMHGGAIDIRNRPQGGVCVTVGFSTDTVQEGLPEHVTSPVAWPYNN
jgi:signal transduction histidine kinase